MPAEPFTRTFHVRWGDLDSNAHMRNTAFLDFSVDVRMMHFQERGISLRDLERLRIGPVVKRDVVEYYREFRLLDAVRVTLMLAGLSEDGSRMCLRNEFFREDGLLAARISSTGGWLDLTARKLTRPPEQVLAALQALVHSDDYEVLPSSLAQKSGDE